MLLLTIWLQFLFNNLVQPPQFLRPPPALIASTVETEETETLLASSVLEESAILPADLGQGGFDVLPADEHIRASED